MIIREGKELNERQRRLVREKVRERGVTCGSCGSDDVAVGSALYLGFLFLTEPQGMHMVALTCKKPGCDNPRMGIKLHESEFLRDE